MHMRTSSQQSNRMKRSHQQNKSFGGQSDSSAASFFYSSRPKTSVGRHQQNISLTKGPLTKILDVANRPHTRDNQNLTGGGMLDDLHSIERVFRPVDSDRHK